MDPYYMEITYMLVLKAFFMWLGIICLYKTVRAIVTEVYGAE